MGASLSVAVSSTTSKDIVNIITNVIVKRTSTCAGTTVLDAAQDMDLSGSVISNSKVIQAVNAIVDISCLSSSTEDTQLQSEIETKLKQFAETKATANPTLFNANAAISVSNSVSEVVRNIASNVEVDSIKSCINAYKGNLTQKLRATNATISDSEISQQITMRVVTECILSDVNQVSRIDKLSSIIDQSSKTSALSGFSTEALTAISIAIVVVCCSVFVISAMTSYSESKAR